MLKLELNDLEVHDVYRALNSQYWDGPNDLHHARRLEDLMNRLKPHVDSDFSDGSPVPNDSEAPTEFTV